MKYLKITFAASIAVIAFSLALVPSAAQYQNGAFFTPISSTIASN